MAGFKAFPFELDGLLLIEGPAFTDERGVFMESFREDEFLALGLPRFVQDNLSVTKKGWVRGMHYQIPPKPVGKLVRCAHGRVFDAAVDLRRKSRTYGKWAGLELSDAGNRMLWVPPGFAHGFLALTDGAVVQYKVTDYWSPAVDRGVRWNDPAIAIRWPLAEARATAKDERQPLLKDADNPF